MRNREEVGQLEHRNPLDVNQNGFLNDLDLMYLLELLELGNPLEYVGVLPGGNVSDLSETWMC
jgi:hypothetical protein